jgi:DnaK suppressor protein
MVTQEQTLRLKTVIQNMRRELVREIHAQAGAITITEGEHDPLDQIQSMIIREQNATQLGRRSRLLSELDQSLHAMSDGSYGLCIDCEEPVSIKRLESIPWASRCIRCQQQLEYRETEYRRAA